MHKVASLVLSLPLIACVIGDSAPTGDLGAGPGSGSGSGSGGATGPDHIASDTTWSGTFNVNGTLTVDTGVTVTVAAGTKVLFGDGASIVVLGTIDFQGSKASVINVSPATTGSNYGDILIDTGASVKMSYVTQVGGGILVNGGTFTATDTYMSQSASDFLTVDAGTVNVSYSQLGLDSLPGTDITHCDLHFEAAGATLSVTHSTISTSTYGLMLYSGTNVDLTYNNWIGNLTDIYTMPNVAGDVSNGYFAQGAPVAGPGAVLTANTLSPNRLPVDQAGPR